MGAQGKHRIRQGLATLVLLVVALAATNVASARPAELALITKAPRPGLGGPRVEAPVWRHPRTIHLRFDSGCVFTMEHGIVPIVWPHGTRMEDDGTIVVHGVRLRDGDAVTVDGYVQQHGGLVEGDLDRCLGESRDAFWVERVLTPEELAPPRR